jgi:phosphatidylethanolamine-binding protein (PEBP) family uncharacterized protein
LAINPCHFAGVRIRIFRRTVVALAIAVIMGTTSMLGSAHAATGSLTVTSPAVQANGVLPADYTCDGSSATLPLTWSKAPKGTKSIAVLMDHIPPEGGHHWYWVMWGIPSTTTSLPKNVTGVGYVGGNSVNSSVGYAPPCSKGPGQKTYAVTVFALSAQPALPHSSIAAVSRDVLLKAISRITLAKGMLNVTYTR